ncbi:hypothetical protein pb186bvf_002862 [Paramecium bursaria]
MANNKKTFLCNNFLKIHESMNFQHQKPYRLWIVFVINFQIKLDSLYIIEKKIIRVNILNE